MCGDTPPPPPPRVYSWKSFAPRIISGWASRPVYVYCSASRTILFASLIAPPDNAYLPFFLSLSLSPLRFCRKLLALPTVFTADTRPFVLSLSWGLSSQGNSILMADIRRPSEYSLASISYILKITRIIASLGSGGKKESNFPLKFSSSSCTARFT